MVKNNLCKNGLLYLDSLSSLAHRASTAFLTSSPSSRCFGCPRLTSNCTASIRSPSMNLSTTTCKIFIMNNFMVSVSMNKRTYLEGVQLVRFDLWERKPGLLDKSRFIQFKGVIPLLAILEGDFMAVSIGRSIKVPLDLIQKVEPGSARIDFRSKSRSLYRGPCRPWNIS